MKHQATAAEIEDEMDKLLAELKSIRSLSDLTPEQEKELIKKLDAIHPGWFVVLRENETLQ